MTTQNDLRDQKKRVRDAQVRQLALRDEYVQAEADYRREYALLKRMRAEFKGEQPIDLYQAYANHHGITRAEAKDVLFHAVHGSAFNREDFLRLFEGVFDEAAMERLIAANEQRRTKKIAMTPYGAGSADFMIPTRSRVVVNFPPLTFAPEEDPR